MGNWRDQARELYAKRSYTSDPPTLALGVCEEAGEVAKAVNVFFNPKFIPKGIGADHDSLDNEISDLLMYLAALANATDSDIDF